jgi:uncharacterized iron-regulated membrane protein
MIKPLLIRFHRWITLVFALPLLAIIVTGLILSVEPIIQTTGLKPQSLDAERLVSVIERYDPDGKARGLVINAATQTMSLQGIDAPRIDLATGDAATNPSSLPDVFLWARRTHERLLGQSWLVTSSTIAMLVIMTLGIAMGLPRLRNNLSGWHKGAAWFALPLVVLSPLTGLFMALGLTLSSGAPPANPGSRITLTNAVNIIAKSRDLAQVVSIGTRGGRIMARLYEGGELRAYTLTTEGMVALPRNWPRLLHEGNWSALIAGPLNVVTSFVLLGLLTTGLLIWGRRKLRRPQRRSRDPRGQPEPLKSAA